MLPDFSGENIQGRSFKGQNLAGVNFSYADIRGADFTDAILRGTNFSYAIAGLQYYWAILLNLVSLLLAIISGAAAKFTSGLATTMYRYPVPGISSEIRLAIVLVVLAIFSIFIARRGVLVDLVALLGAVAGGLIVVGAIAGALDFAGIPNGGLRLVMRVAWDLAGTLPWALTGVLTGALAVSLLWTLAESLSQILVRASVLAGMGILAWTNVATLFKPVDLIVIDAIIVVVGIVVVSLAIYLGWRAFDEDENFALIRTITIAIAATGGTSFRGADLTNAEFTHAILKSTDFRKANLIRANVHKVKHLNRTRVGTTIFIDPKVRDLAVTKRGANQSFVGCNFRGANLANADLSDADLTEVNASEATFAGAWLERANLSKLQALKTNFQQARLTGACLEAWNIDSTTQLEGIICDFVYLLNNYQERRPSSGEFGSGEFTKLFQVALNTIDLIFRNGLNVKALSTALEKVSIKNQATQLSLQSIENKGDGVVVVRVSTSPQADKAKLHTQLIQQYKLSLQALKEKYRVELKGKDEQIAIYRQHQADLKELLKRLASRPIHNSANQSIIPKKSLEGKLVTLKLGKGDFNTGFPVTLQIGTEGTLPSVEVMGELPSAVELPDCYREWQLAYRSSIKASFRIEVPTTQVTNISRSEFLEECHKTAENLKNHLNIWLNSESFRSIRERLLEKLDASESIRLILQTGDSKLRRLPWHLWDFFDRYPKAELALSTPIYERVEKLVSPKAKVKILAILGNSTGIDIQKDRAMIEQLPDADVTFLVEPQRQELNDQLWAQSWDILFFAGHSSSQADDKTGEIYINQTDSLTVTQLKHALKNAIAQGLRLAIFNSCDGLGLAINLADLHLPQIIVMREPVPDQVAQEFLKNFLSAFASGKPLYQSVREAREKLQGLEDRFPCATWLPAICQNLAEAPLTWQELRGN